MKSHDTFLELAAVAIDFPISATERAGLDRHLAGCAACQRSVAGFRMDARAIASTPVPGLAERRGAAMLSAILHPSAVRGSLRLAIVVALIGLVLLGSLAVGARLISEMEPNPFVMIPPIASPNASGSPIASAPVPSAPSASPTPSGQSPSPRPVTTVSPPVADAPASGPGFAPTRVSQADGYGTAVTVGASGWMVSVLFDGEIPVIPRLRTSTDLVSWIQQKPNAAGMEGGMNWTLAASGSGYAAGGAGLWCSADGRAWRPATLADAAGAPEAGGVASDGRAYVAWHRSLAAAGIWYSPDGCSYEPVQLPGAPAVIVDAVAASPAGGFVIAGRSGETIAALDAVEAESVDWAARPGRQAVWTSTDGRSWVPVPIGPGFDGARITSIAAGGPGGGLLAAGIAVPDADGVRTPAVWRYTEAAGWQRLTGMPAFGSPSIDPAVPGAIATPGRWLVTGHDGAGRWGVVGGSDDGTAWWQVELAALGGEAGGYTIDGAAWLDRRLVFLVNRSSGSPDLAGTVEIWTSG